MPSQKKKLPMEGVEGWDTDDVNKWLISVRGCVVFILLQLLCCLKGQNIVILNLEHCLVHE